MGSASEQITAIPDDDPTRGLTLARPDTDNSLVHLAVVGDTYTIVVTGRDTAGRYTLIDMHVPPGGGPRSAQDQTWPVSVASTAGARSTGAGSGANDRRRLPPHLRKLRDRRECGYPLQARRPPGVQRMTRLLETRATSSIQHQ
jgi:hypothetical protein